MKIFVSKQKMDKNVILFILFIILLFFVSNDPKFNKIFQKGVIKIIFIFSLVYMYYLKINVAIILGLFFIFILFYTNLGKKLQKNKHIKRILKVCTPLFEFIEDTIQMIYEDGDDNESEEASVKSTKRYQQQQIETKSEEEINDSDFDILDEIRNDMAIPQLKSKDEEEEEQSSPIHEETHIEDSDGIVEPDVVLDRNQVKELYQQFISVKNDLENINE